MEYYIFIVFGYNSYLRSKHCISLIGIHGEKGEQGAIGAIGPHGAPGRIGERGPAGPQGAVGMFWHFEFKIRIFKRILIDV